MKTWLGIVISFVLINSALAEIRWDIPEIHSAAVATIGDLQNVMPPPFGEIFQAWQAHSRLRARLDLFLKWMIQGANSCKPNNRAKLSLRFLKLSN